MLVSCRTNTLVLFGTVWYCLAPYLVSELIQVLMRVEQQNLNRI